MLGSGELEVLDELGWTASGSRLGNALVELGDLAVRGPHGVDGQAKHGAMLEALVGGGGEGLVEVEDEILGRHHGGDAAPGQGVQAYGEIAGVAGVGDGRRCNIGAFWTIWANLTAARGGLRHEGSTQGGWGPNSSPHSRCQDPVRTPWGTQEGTAPPVAGGRDCR